MRFIVFTNCFYIGEAASTLTAFKWLFAGVHAKMFFQMRSGHETLATFAASVWSLASVRPCVQDQMILAGKLLPAETADASFLSCMCQHVTSQSFGSCEFTITNGAHVMFRRWLVRAHVSLQHLPCCIQLTAVFATETTFRLSDALFLDCDLLFSLI